MYLEPSRKSYTVTVTYSDGSQESAVFKDAVKARIFAYREVEWEDCARVVCPELSLDIRGQFT